jgi:hypothetical protein
MPEEVDSHVLLKYEIVERLGKGVRSSLHVFTTVSRSIFQRVCLPSSVFTALQEGFAGWVRQRPTWDASLCAP